MCKLILLLIKLSNPHSLSNTLRSTNTVYRLFIVPPTSGTGFSSKNTVQDFHKLTIICIPEYTTFHKHGAGFSSTNTVQDFGRIFFHQPLVFFHQHGAGFWQDFCRIFAGLSIFSHRHG